MRKKSHVSLTGYLLRNIEIEELQVHKKAFAFGSILPDCMPSFITRRHNIEDTFSVLKKELSKVTDNYNPERGISTYFCRHLGVITHYIADYFTLPHNNIFKGNLKEHCSYEKELKNTLRAYVYSDAAKRVRGENGSFQTVDDICAFIKRMHVSYLRTVSTVKADCRYIVELVFRVVDAILQIFELKYQVAQSRIAEVI